MTPTATNPIPMSEATGKRLRAMRFDRGLTRAELAAEADVPEAVVRRAELGGVPRPAAAVKIAAVFGMRASQLWPVDGDGS